MRLYNRPRVADRRRLMLIMVPLSGDDFANKLKQNVNTVCILTLTMAFQDGSIHAMSPIKWGTITKLGCAPGPSIKPSLNMIQLGEQMPTRNRWRLNALACLL